MAASLYIHTAAQGTAHTYTRYLLFFPSVVLVDEAATAWATAGLVHGRAVPVAEHGQRHDEQRHRYRQRQDQVAQVVVPRVSLQNKKISVYRKLS